MFVRLNSKLLQSRLLLIHGVLQVDFGELLARKLRIIETTESLRKLIGDCVELRPEQRAEDISSSIGPYILEFTYLIIIILFIQLLP